MYKDVSRTVMRSLYRTLRAHVSSVLMVALIMTIECRGLLQTSRVRHHHVGVLTLPDFTKLLPGFQSRKC